MTKRLLLTILLAATFIGCDGDNGDTPSLGQSCEDNINVTDVYCEDGSPILVCIDGTYEDPFSDTPNGGYAPPEGCVFSCSNPDGAGSYDTVCD